MIGFWDSNVWSGLLIIAILFLFMMIAHILRRKIPFLNKSLIPPSVLGGILILIFTTTYKLITGDNFFELDIFSISKSVENTSISINALSGLDILEIITYHALGVGFICMGLRSSKKEKNKQRTKEIFNSGLTTVTTYLIQAIVGLSVTMIAAVILTDLKGFNPAAGIILCLGFGQGTGQALNFGSQYEADYGFIGGANFGLAVAAMGFLVAAIGGVIVLNVLRKKGKVKGESSENSENLDISHYQTTNEIPSGGSIDKLTIQVAFVICIYAIVYLVMYGISALVGEGLRATIFGFNFLFGTIFAVVFKFVLNKLREKKIVNRVYINDFMMNRIGGVAFDIMIVAGIAAIDISTLKSYLGILIIMGILGAISTFLYVMFVSKKLFKEYQYEQFFAMYGMLTGTASTGVILLREIDPNFETPASDNLVYQTLPAIVFGFPLMFLIPFAAKGWTETLLVFSIVIVMFIILTVVLFRSFIFKKKNK